MKPGIVSLALIAAACGSIPFEPIEDNERLGVVKFEDEAVNINVPETAAVGDTVTISVASWGAEPCVTKGRTRVTRSGSTLVVEPIDSLPLLQPGTVCTTSLDLFIHEAIVVFPEAGSVEVVVRGREWPADKPYSATRRITVH